MMIPADFDGNWLAFVPNPVFLSIKPLKLQFIVFIRAMLAMRCKLVYNALGLAIRQGEPKIEMDGPGASRW
jgi:hypothetical protein